MKLGDRTFVLVPVISKPHIWWMRDQDEFRRGWYVIDPINALPLGPFSEWGKVQRVAKSCWQSLEERR